MPPPPGIPPELIPGGARNGGLQANTNTGVYGDAYQTHSPTDIPDPTTGAPWANSSAPNPEQTDNRLGRPQEPGQGQRERSTPRDRSRQNGPAGGKSPGNTSRICRKCGEPLLGQFVRALGGTYHLECFQCNYHIELFTCSVCPAIFGAQDSYYEHDAKVYCHYHYSTCFAQRCNGCQTAILKQFVEIFRNGQNQHWHPECYMIHKFWNVRLAPNGQEYEPPELDVDAPQEERDRIRKKEDEMEEKVYRIWSVLSTFEESSAQCISDMLLHVSNGAYADGVVVAKKFIFHVEVLFKGTDRLAAVISSKGMKDLSYAREAKLLCKKIVAFFALLSKTQETGVRKLGVTQELLALVTGLAHYLKLLIRIGLQGALKVERETQSADELFKFLQKAEDLDGLNRISASGLTSNVERLANQQSDCCAACKDPIDDECISLGERLWHKKPPHLVCGACQDDLTMDLSRARWSEKNDRPYCRACAEQRGHDSQAIGGFVYVTRLQQYVFLLEVALARLLAVLRSGGTLPHTSDDPNLNQYEANDGHRVSATGELQSPPQRANTRSNSYAEASKDTAPSSLEQTVGEMRRLRSTRNERAVSTTFKKARTSRIIDGPKGSSARPGSSGVEGDSRQYGFQIVEERGADGEPITDLTFGNQDALTLDDISRIVAAEQAKEHRPNAFKHARTGLVASAEPTPKIKQGHQRELSNAEDRQGQQPPKHTKYFSELSALEYFIVRHVAVLSMQPLVEGHFNLEELLELIETRKPTIWNIFGKAFKNDSRKGGKKKGVFGVNLEQLVDRDGTESTHGVGPGNLRIPTFVDDAISAMRQMDMSVEGVFRKNGNIRRLKDTAELIDTKYETADLNKESPVQVAALLKKFLREMPDPLLTFKLHKLFIVSQNEESGSKMDIHNLATVMTPNILYSNTKAAGVDDSFLAIEAVTSLLEFNDSMCEVPHDLQSILNDSSLFNREAEITTKEILKRWGEIAKFPVPQRTPTGLDSLPARSGSNRGSNTPVATRIDGDPSQATAWQMQSSVRHVQPQQAHDGSELRPHAQPIRSDSGDSYHSQGYSHQQQIPYRSQQPIGQPGI
ncbi:rho-GTPase-activating protein LRG1 [Coccidioides immitis H538.4]|uniref:Rho-GTPase-activating protein LRG1 n=1 Tax=Coccidioides immitis H538.4 TaxID=396776 RepID=A0A0J8RWA5_COCIT|nr:rho-GTPase-activating protein LRG1 [Coccidioides immitis H538.4]